MRVERFNKNRYGAAILIVLGAAVSIAGFSYKFGSLNRMGAGFMPVVLGVLLILVGLAIGLTDDAGGARRVTATLDHGRAESQGPEWRGWGCIVGGVAAFVLLGQYGGLVPASFFSVFIAALGDRNATLKSSAILAAVLSVFGVAIFYYALSLQLPLFKWGG